MLSTMALLPFQTLKMQVRCSSSTWTEGVGELTSTSRFPLGLCSRYRGQTHRAIEKVKMQQWWCRPAECLENHCHPREQSAASSGRSSTAFDALFVTELYIKLKAVGKKGIGWDAHSATKGAVLMTLAQVKGERTVDKCYNAFKGIGNLSMVGE